LDQADELDLERVLDPALESDLDSDFDSDVERVASRSGQAAVRRAVRADMRPQDSVSASRGRAARVCSVQPPAPIAAACN